MAASASDDRVLVLAPIGRDGYVVTHTLASSNIACEIAETIEDLTAKLGDGAGALLITEEAVSSTGLVSLLAVLGGQPPWSDLPIILLLREGARGAAKHLTLLTSTRNVTVLERPIPAVTLITAVQTALSARRRQYQVRDLLGREQQAREVAEHSVRIKDEFLATVSHELRTPMSAILLWSQLLEAGHLNDEAVIQAVHGLAESAQAQSRLIEDLLDQSRMLTGTLRITLQPQHLGPIVIRASEVVRPTADVKGVRLEVELGTSDDLVLADADRVQQIVWNLLSNAVKFTPSGGVVSLRLLRDDDHLTVTVIDSGEGIPPDLLPQVFDRFRQGRAEPDPRRNGLGLGLTIARQLVELHGGTIRATSGGIGKGATFTMRLPTLPPEQTVATHRR